MCVVEAGIGCLPEYLDAGLFVVYCMLRVGGKSSTHRGWEGGTCGLSLYRGLKGTGLRY